MKRMSWILRVLTLGAVGVTGCGGGPTAPGDPAKLDLTGTWTGTITDTLGSCPQEPFSVVLSQGEAEINAGGQVAKVSGNFSTPCEGSLSIQGSLSGGRMYGSISGKGRITGTATSHAIEITVLGGGGGLDNGQVVVCRIAMQK